MRRSKGGQGWVGDEYQSRAHSTIPPTTLWRGVVQARVFSEEEHRKFPPGLLGPYPPTLAGMAADIHSADERGDQRVVNGLFYTTPGHQGLNDLLRDNFIINVYNNKY